MNYSESDRKQVWETYAKAWSKAKLSDRLSLFQESLDSNCIYTAPNNVTRGWDELNTEIEQLQVDAPGGSFTTTYFLAHHQYCFAKWNLVGKDGRILSSGQSVGEFHPSGKLVSMTGFFELPGNKRG